MAKNSGNKLSTAEKDKLVQKLRTRFEKNMGRHKGMDWGKVLDRLEAKPAKLWSLSEMERTDGEPDVIGHDKKSGEIIFADCSAESPKGRRSLCYDRKALNSRKEFKPKNSVMDLAADMGVELMNEEQYRELQKLGVFDAKSSSWILTPDDIREKGGAVSCEYRFGHVFVYPNGAESYFASRGFRALLKV